MDLQDKVALGAAMFGTPSVNTGASTMLAEVVSDAKDGEVAVWMRDEEGNEQKVEIPCDGDLREGDVATVIVQDGRATAISAGGAGERSKAETEAAQQAASTAQSTAETAQTDATQAKTDAADAKETAAGAETAAGEAKDAAADATQAASDAQSAADTAKSAADAATSAAADASTKADNAASAATNAGNKADAASTKADAAGTKADAAQSTANTAQQAAIDAQTDATNAAKAANDATDAATKAQTDATNAAKVASDAQTDAAAAKTTAETAQTTAQTASDTATAAQTAVAATKQHFWADDEGAHVATTAHEEGAAIEGSNLLATSDGVQIRDGETALSEFGAKISTLNKGTLSLTSESDTFDSGRTHYSGSVDIICPEDGTDKTAFYNMRVRWKSDGTLDKIPPAQIVKATASAEYTAGGTSNSYNLNCRFGSYPSIYSSAWDVSTSTVLAGDKISIGAAGDTSAIAIKADCETGSGVTVNGTDIMLLAYPVGSIYMSVNSTSPADLFGGTWEEIAGGRVLMGQNSTYTAGTTGGEAAHTLTANEMPKHGHGTGNSTFNTFAVTKADGDITRGTVASGSGVGDVVKSPNPLNNDRTSTATAGGGAAHNNLPPYLAVYMWKRTA